MVDFKNSEIVKRFKHKYKKNIIEYIELVYVKDSELKHVTDVKERKRQALSKAGIIDDELKNELIFLRTDDIKELVFFCLSVYNSMRFSKLWTDMSLFYDLQRRMLGEITETEDDKVGSKYKLRTDLSKQSEELLQRIEKAILDIYPNKEEMELIESNIRIKTADERVTRKSR